MASGIVTPSTSSAAKPTLGRKPLPQQSPAPKVRRPSARAARVAGASADVLQYDSAKGVHRFVRAVAQATPLQLVGTERRGVEGAFVKDISRSMNISAVRMFEILGVPKATAERKVAAGEIIAGSGGQAAIGMAKLMARAQDMVAHSTAPAAQGFDAARWLGQWLEVPQPALGGCRPADLLDTPTGTEVVLRLLGAIESGAYQ
jgi:putative toxin-antitoxin system antitoxin component (TIGR02293 family)